MDTVVEIADVGTDAVPQDQGCFKLKACFSSFRGCPPHAEIPYREQVPAAFPPLENMFAPWGWRITVPMLGQWHPVFQEISSEASVQHVLRCSYLPRLQAP